MSEKRITGQAEQLTEVDLSFWRSCFRQALPDCLSIDRTPEYCAHIAGEVADASLREYRARFSDAALAERRTSQRNAK